MDEVNITQRDLDRMIEAMAENTKLVGRLATAIHNQGKDIVRLAQSFETATGKTPTIPQSDRAGFVVCLTLIVAMIAGGGLLFRQMTVTMGSAISNTKETADRERADRIADSKRADSLSTRRDSDQKAYIDHRDAELREQVHRLEAYFDALIIQRMTGGNPSP